MIVALRWIDLPIEAILDVSHASAVAAGTTEVAPPRDLEGMPRCSAVKDPSGNWIWLYQG